MPGTSTQADRDRDHRRKRILLYAPEPVTPEETVAAVLEFKLDTLFAEREQFLTVGVESEALEGEIDGVLDELELATRLRLAEPLH